MQNEKPQRKNQDSAGGMGNFPSRDLFAYALNFTQSQIALQLSRILYKSAVFYAKQSQFPENQNERKYLHNKGLCKF